MHKKTNDLKVTQLVRTNYARVLDFASKKKKVVKSKEYCCTHRESNPGQMLGRHLCYHYTIGALYNEKEVKTHKYNYLDTFTSLWP